MAQLIELDGVAPTMGADAYLAPHGALIGMGAIALQRARVGAGSVLAAGAVLGEGAVVAPGTLAAGVPAREKKALSGSALRWSKTAADEYDRVRARYLRGAAEIGNH
jgi:carbonic anhydrase/acetyltransferase-like protein (isoleucine patch superfamily)